MVRSIEEATSSLRGIFNIAVTPFGADGAVEYSALTENIERVLVMGYDGILVGGQYGEFATMATDERAELFRRTMDIVGGRLPVLLGATHSDARVVAELTQLASSLGGIPMVTAPYVSEVTEPQVLAFFREIAPLSKIGVTVYNMPEIGYTIRPHLLEQIADIPGVIGVKQGDLAPAAVDRIAGRLLDRFRVMCSSDLSLFGPLMSGFHGVTCSNSSCLPELILKIYRSFEKGDVAAAMKLHRLWYPIRELLRETGQPQTIKAIMNLRGWFGGHVRAPLRDLNEEQLKRLSDEMANLARHPEAEIRLAAGGGP